MQTIEFDPNAVESPKSLYFALRLSGLAYSNEAQIRKEIADFGGRPEAIQFIYGENLFGFIAQFPEFAFVSFRGTQTLGDWINNLDVRTFHTFCGDIHRGLVGAMNSIADNFVNTIAAWQPRTPLFLTGHSRGGAFAVLAAALLKQIEYEPVAIYTFGQPKVGTKRFVEWWDKNMSARYFRVVNGSDIVPHLPPRPVDIPYFTINGICIGLLILLLPFRVAFRLIARSRSWLFDDS